MDKEEVRREIKSMHLDAKVKGLVELGIRLRSISCLLISLKTSPAFEAWLLSRARRYAGEEPDAPATE